MALLVQLNRYFRQLILQCFFRNVSKEQLQPSAIWAFKKGIIHESLKAQYIGSRWADNTIPANYLCYTTLGEMLCYVSVPNWRVE